MEGLVGGFAANQPLLTQYYKAIVILSVAKNLKVLVGQ